MASQEYGPNTPGTRGPQPDADPSPLPTGSNQFTLSLPETGRTRALVDAVKETGLVVIGGRSYLPPELSVEDTSLSISEIRQGLARGYRLEHPTHPELPFRRASLDQNGSVIITGIDGRTIAVSKVQMEAVTALDRHVELLEAAAEAFSTHRYITYLAFVHAATAGDAGDPLVAESRAVFNGISRDQVKPGAALLSTIYEGPRERSRLDTYLNGTIGSDMLNYPVIIPPGEWMRVTQATAFKWAQEGLGTVAVRADSTTNGNRWIGLYIRGCDDSSLIPARPVDNESLDSDPARFIGTHRRFSYFLRVSDPGTSTNSEMPLVASLARDRQRMMKSPPGTIDVIRSRSEAGHLVDQRGIRSLGHLITSLSSIRNACAQGAPASRYSVLAANATGSQSDTLLLEHADLLAKTPVLEAVALQAADRLDRLRSKIMFSEPPHDVYMELAARSRLPAPPSLEKGTWHGHSTRVLHQGGQHEGLAFAHRAASIIGVAVDYIGQVDLPTAVELHLQIARRVTAACSGGSEVKKLLVTYAAALQDSKQARKHVDQFHTLAPRLLTSPPNDNPAGPHEGQVLLRMVQDWREVLDSRSQSTPAVSHLTLAVRRGLESLYDLRFRTGHVHIDSTAHSDEAAAHFDQARLVAKWAVDTVIKYSALRSTPFDRAWATPKVIDVVKSIRSGGQEDRMRDLADALADAGCSTPGVIDHLRGPGPFSPHDPVVGWINVPFRGPASWIRRLWGRPSDG